MLFVCSSLAFFPVLPIVTKRCGLLQCLPAAFFSPLAWVYLRPRWASWSADWQCLLGALLSGAWHTARRTDALRQNHRRWRWLLQHLLQWDGRRETRSPRRVYWPRAYCRGLVHRCEQLYYAHAICLRMRSDSSSCRFFLKCKCK